MVCHSRDLLSGNLFYLVISRNCTIDSCFHRNDRLYDLFFPKSFLHLESSFLFKYNRKDSLFKPSSFAGADHHYLFQMVSCAGT